MKKIRVLTHKNTQERIPPKRSRSHVLLLTGVIIDPPASSSNELIRFFPQRSPIEMVKVVAAPTICDLIKSIFYLNYVVIVCKL